MKQSRSFVSNQNSPYQSLSKTKEIEVSFYYDCFSQIDIHQQILARLDRNGNISGFRKGLSSGKYKIIKSKNGKERLIDTTKKDTKKTTKRIVGIREEKRRKIIYDFYKEVDKGVRVIMSGIEGTFRIRKK